MLKIKAEREKQKSGFTFIELLTAVTVFSIIAVSVCQTIFLGVKVWDRCGFIIRQNHSLRVFFNDAAGDFSNAVPFSFFNDSAYLWEEDCMVFPAIRNIRIDGKAGSEITAVKYRFDRAAGVVFKAYAGVKDGFDLSRPEEQIAVSGAGNISFEYADVISDKGGGISWQKEWKSGGKYLLPAAVRINIALNEGTPDKEFVEKIFILKGKR